MALFGHAQSGGRCLLLGVERKSHFKADTSVFDPGGYSTFSESGTDELNFQVFRPLIQTRNRFSSLTLLLKNPAPAELHKD